MPEHINPGLFARLMGLSHPERNDLLEFLGQTPVADAELERLIEGVCQRDGPPQKDPPLS